MSQTTSHGVLCVAMILLITAFQPAIGSTTKQFPRGCTEVGFTFKNNALLLIPEQNQQTVYLMNNTTRQSLEVKYFDPKHPDLGTWTTVMKPRRWSSFAADMPMLFSCSTQGQKSVAVDCAKALELCQYPRAKVPLHMHGTYFIVKDQYSMNAAVRDTIREGVLLRW